MEDDKVDLLNLKLEEVTKQKNFFWDSFILSIALLISGLSVTGIIDTLFSDENSVACCIETDNRNKYNFITSYCYKDVHNIKYFPVIVLLQSAFLIAPHYAWKAIISAKIDAFLSHLAKVEILREKDTGKYRYHNYTIVKYLQREFSDSYRISCYYIFKLAVQVVSVIASFVLHWVVFLDEYIKDITFTCKDDDRLVYKLLKNESLDSSSEKKSLDSVICTYPRMTLINLLVWFDLFLISLAFILLICGLIWVLCNRSENNYNCTIADFCYNSSIDPQYCYKLSKEVYFQNNSFQIRDDFTFLLASLDFGYTRVFNTILIEKIIYRIFSKHSKKLIEENYNHTKNCFCNIKDWVQALCQSLKRVLCGETKKNQHNIQRLCDAAGDDRLEDVRALVNSGVDVNVRDRTHHTPLNRAMKGHHADIVTFLLSKHAKYNIEGLCDAAGDGRLEHVKAHVDKGVDVNGRDRTHHTPLNRAMKGHHAEVVAFLLSQNAKYNIEGLCDAAGDGRLEHVKAHVDNGVDVHGRDRTYDTPLNRAMKGDHAEVVKFLLSQLAKDFTSLSEFIPALCWDIIKTPKDKSNLVTLDIASGYHSYMLDINNSCEGKVVSVILGSHHERKIETIENTVVISMKTALNKPKGTEMEFTAELKDFIGGKLNLIVVGPLDSEHKQSTVNQIVNNDQLFKDDAVMLVIKLSKVGNKVISDDFFDCNPNMSSWKKKTLGNYYVIKEGITKRQIEQCSSTYEVAVNYQGSKCKFQLKSYIFHPQGDRPTIEQLQDVMRIKLIVITTKWRELGQELLNSYVILQDIEAEEHDDNSRCRLMFEKWLNLMPDASWSRLVTALKSIELNNTANVVRTQYNLGDRPLPTTELLEDLMNNRDIGITTLWRKLGQELLNVNDTLQVIEADHPNDDNSCCRLMFDKWLNIIPNASWSRLVTALNNIELTTAAYAVSKQYVLGDRPTIEKLQGVMENKDIGITTRWRELGQKLLNSNDTLQVIEADHSIDDNSCCGAMFEKWLEITPNASWSRLVTALNNIDLNDAAGAVEQLYQIAIENRPSKEQLQYVMSIENNVITTKWRELGQELLNSNVTLQVIEADKHDDNSRCRLMFDKWLKLIPNASWSQLVTALNNIELNTAAAVIKRYKLVPEMFDLMKIVIPKIFNEWEYVAAAFHYDLATINAIKKRERGEAEQCCIEFFKDWLTTEHGNRVGPKVWSTLLDILNKVDKISAKIKEEIASEVQQLRLETTETN